MFSSYLAKLFSFVALYFIPFIILGEGHTPYEARFEPKFENGLLYLNINLAPDYTIYSSQEGNDAFPTVIDLNDSNNLEEYRVIWPAPYKEYLSIGGVKYVYSTNVSIPIEIKPTDHREPVTIQGTVQYAICKDMCVPVRQEISLVIDQVPERRDTYHILYIAILGGLILNFMPCVLPVLLLKVFNIIQGQGRAYRLQLIASVAGIFTVFMGVGYITSILKSVVIGFGIGGNFQHPEFIIILCLMMTLFTSNVLGRSEFALPEKFSSKINNIRFGHVLFDSFMAGVLAALFSTPCTAPFLGTAVSFAMTAEFNQIMQIFASIALGFSIPYLMLILTPRLGTLLPSPGPWMGTFKKILAVGMITTIFWLLNVLSHQIGYRATLGSALLLLLIKFIFEQQQMNRTLRNIILGMLIGGLLYLPGIATEQDHREGRREELLWKKFTISALEEAKKENKVVVVDITARWCVSCKYNDIFLWSRNRTLGLLSNPRIIAFRGDVTNPVREIEQYLISFGVYGIPFNIVYGPQAPLGIVLPVFPSYNELQKALEDAGL